MTELWEPSTLQEQGQEHADASTTVVQGSTAAHGRQSSAFDLLSPTVQRWVDDAQWSDLRTAQEDAIPLLLAEDRDVLISAATAGGKTEAAFLPILSALEISPSTGHGVQVLYIAPLKALINDQFGRLEEMCKHMDLAVHRWHGDVAASSKRAVLTTPRGVLLLTPESLEAMFVLRGTQIARVFGGLRYVVVDELHAFLGTERGAQLVSLLHRLELASKRRIVRVGLSATLGNMSLAAAQLRPGDPAQVALVVSQEGGQHLSLIVRGYTDQAPPPPACTADQDPTTAAENDTEDDLQQLMLSGGQGQGDQVTEPLGSPQEQIVEHLFTNLRGTDNLVFANSRSQVEVYADLLRRRSERAHVPNEFVIHHGSLAKSLREDAEAALKDPNRPTTAIATTTLEMGIDIGSVTSIGQIGPPPSVSSLRQRLGRSGRRGAPPILRTYLVEAELDARSSLDDELRARLMQSIAMIELHAENWCEPPRAAALHTSTLVQQLLSLIAQHGGVTAPIAHVTLCGPDGPFAGTDRRRFAGLLHSLAAARVLEQDPDGTLLLGQIGERTVNHYTFYTAFQTPQEYRLLAGGQQLGTLPIDFPVYRDLLMVFAGQRWRVLNVDDRQRTIDLARAAAGSPPRFGGTGLAVHDVVRTRMRTVLAGTHVPSFLNDPAAELLAQARQMFGRHRLADRSLLPQGPDTIVVPWAGTTTSHTLALEMNGMGVPCTVDGLALTCPRSSPTTVLGALKQIVAQGPADPVLLATSVKVKAENKYDPWLSEHLLNQDYAARRLDTEASHRAAQRLLREARSGVPAT